ncbi:hypothetical protein roselon_02460 [Roseibacterium elongatum DSM 19469]|uniref:Uncharacterized protein n=1 Tax=Roseicyclus elongatus DSM 19469 TaxID=1294273 RepID=W8RU76_9RHOB|nr:hypothetical protein roselon_02460 [Roseibacterium elongatum DSM 19469]
MPRLTSVARPVLAAALLAIGALPAAAQQIGTVARPSDCAAPRRGRPPAPWVSAPR